MEIGAILIVGQRMGGTEERPIIVTSIGVPLDENYLATMVALQDECQQVITSDPIDGTLLMITPFGPMQPVIVKVYLQDIQAN